MKSQFLTRNKSIDDETLDAIVNLTKLERDELIAIIKTIKEDALKTKSTRRDQITHIIKGKKVSAQEAISTIRNLISLLASIDEYKDNFDLILDDLISLQKLDESNKETILSQFKLLQEEYDSFFKPRQQELSTVFENMPWLSNFKIKTIIAPFFDPKFDSVKNHVDGFSTEIKNLYIASRISITYSDELDTRKSIAFYTNEAIIDDLINNLLSAKIEIVQAKKIIEKLT